MTTTITKTPYVDLIQKVVESHLVFLEEKKIGDEAIMYLHKTLSEHGWTLEEFITYSK